MGLDELVESLKLPRPPWQHQAVEWELSKDRNERLLLWQMGVGKTTTATVWLRIKYRQRGKIDRTLVLAPLATLSGWLADFQRNAPATVASQAVIVAGSGKKKMPGKKRAELILAGAQRILLTNYETLTMPEPLAALKTFPPVHLVLDEIHRLKNPSSKRLKGLLSFSDKAETRLGLTGTLVLNSFMDVWAPIRVIDSGKRFGTNFYSQFRDKYFLDLNAGMRGKSHYFPDWQPHAGLEQVIAEKLNSLASRKTKEECLDLPPRVVAHVEVGLSAEQQRLYDEMNDDLVSSVERGEATASNALVKLLRMRQIICGFLPIESTDEDPQPARIERFKENQRLDALSDIMEDVCGQSKLVVWSTFRANYPALRKLCEDLKLEYAEYHGETKDKDGNKRKFIEDPKCRVLLANPQAGGTGVDGLQAVSSYCVYFDRSHSAEHYWQSRDRLHRGGAEVHDKITEIHIVACNTIDEEILLALERKENAAEAILSRIKAKLQSR